MQVNWVLLLLAACGAAFFFMLLGVFFFEKFHHFTRRFFMMGLINNLMSDAKDEINDVPETRSRSRARVSGGDLRAQAQSLDFDAAVAKYAQPSANSQTFSAQSARPDPLGPSAPALRSTSSQTFSAQSARPDPLGPSAPALRSASALSHSLDDYDAPPGLRRRRTRRDESEIDIEDEDLDDGLF